MNENNITSKVRAFLNESMAVPEDTADSAALFSTGTLDSVSAIDLVLFLETTFGIKINPIDISIDDLDTIDKISEFVGSRIGS